jgi:hypothetical protein
MLKIGILFIIALHNFDVGFDSPLLGFVTVLSIGGWMTEYNMALRETDYFQSFISVNLFLDGSVWFASFSYLSSFRLWHYQGLQSEDYGSHSVN